MPHPQTVPLIEHTHAIAPEFPNELYDHIAKCIDEEGPMTYADFMEASLHRQGNAFYDSGYYASGYAGMSLEARADFLTYPEHSPFLGMAVARWIHEEWRAMDSPAPFHIIEAGPGTGILARTIHNELHNEYPELAEAAHYTLTEYGRGMIARQQETLDDISVSWTRASAIDLPFANIQHGVFISNELPDAFPAHWVVRRKEEADGYREVYVTLDDQGRFYEIEGPLSSSELRSALGNKPTLTKEGESRIVNLNAEKWMKKMIGAIAGKGSLLVIDYGRCNSITSSSGPRCYANAAPGNHDRKLAFQNPGIVDITTDIDFSVLTEVAEQQEVYPTFMFGQGDFMKDHGHKDAVERVCNQGWGAIDKRWQQRLDPHDPVHFREQVREIAAQSLDVQSSFRAVGYRVKH